MLESVNGAPVAPRPPTHAHYISHYITLLHQPVSQPESQWAELGERVSGSIHYRLNLLQRIIKYIIL